MAITGAFSGETITVDTLIKDPTFIKERVLKDLDGAFLEDALFRQAEPNNGVVAYAEAVSPFLADDAENVAEFAEIPISTMEFGAVKSLIGHKTALAVDVSLEERRFNKIDKVNLKVGALKNTMTRSGVNSALAAFDAANIPTLVVGAAWDTADANPLKDIRAAKRMISQAKADNDRDALMGYRPDTLVISESTLEAALDHDNTQKFFIGNAAMDNPVFKGITPKILADLRIVTSAWLKDDDVILMEAGTVGFRSDAIPLTVSDLYAPHGENGYGGSTQSWRVDAFRHRVIAVDNPKAAVRLTGVFG